MKSIKKITRTSFGKIIQETEKPALVYVKNSQKNMCIRKKIAFDQKFADSLVPEDNKTTSIRAFDNSIRQQFPIFSKANNKNCQHYQVSCPCGKSFNGIGQLTNADFQSFETLLQTLKFVKILIFSLKEACKFMRKICDSQSLIFDFQVSCIYLKCFKCRKNMQNTGFLLFDCALKHIQPFEQEQQTERKQVQILIKVIKELIQQKSQQRQFQKVSSFTLLEQYIELLLQSQDQRIKGQNLSFIFCEQKRVGENLRNKCTKTTFSQKSLQPITNIFSKQNDATNLIISKTCQNRDLQSFKLPQTDIESLLRYRLETQSNDEKSQKAIKINKIVSNGSKSKTTKPKIKENRDFQNYSQLKLKLHQRNHNSFENRAISISTKRKNRNRACYIFKKGTQKRIFTDDHYGDLIKTQKIINKMQNMRFTVQNHSYQMSCKKNTQGCKRWDQIQIISNRIVDCHIGSKFKNETKEELDDSQQNPRHLTKSLSKRETDKQIPQKQQIWFKITYLIQKKLKQQINPIGESINSVSKLLQKKSRQWLIPLYLLYKKFFYLRCSLTSQLEEQKPIIKNISKYQWLQFKTSKMFKDKLQQINKDNKLVYSALSKMQKKVCKLYDKKDIKQQVLQIDIGCHQQFYQEFVSSLVRLNFAQLDNLSKSVNQTDQQQVRVLQCYRKAIQLACKDQNHAKLQQSCEGDILVKNVSEKLPKQIASKIKQLRATK